MADALEEARRAAGGVRPRRIMPPVRARGTSIAASRARSQAVGLARAQAGDVPEVQRRQRPGDPGPKSLLGQVGEIVGGLPGGLIGLGADIATDVVAPVRIGIDLAQGDLERNAGKYLPFLNSMGQSLKTTGGRVTEGVASLAPGGLKPTDTAYARASREGGIAGAVLEDVGNVALVGAVLSGGTTVAAGRAGAQAGARQAAARAAMSGVDDALRSTGRVFEAGPSGTSVRYTTPGIEAEAAAADRAVARAARLQRVAGQMRGTTRALDVAADAPARIFTVPARAAARAVGPRLRPVVERLGETGPGVAVKAGLDARAERRAARAQVVDEILDPMNEEKLKGRRHVGLLARAADRAWLGLSQQTGHSPGALQAAQILRATGQGPVLVRALREADAIGGPELRTRVMRAAVGIERALDDEAVGLIEQIADGTIDPEVLAGMDDAWSWTARTIEETEQRRLTGEGRMRGALSEEQLGDDPMPSAVDRELAPLRQQVQDLLDEVEGYTDPRGERVPGLRQKAAEAAQVAQGRLAAAERRGMIPAGAVERVEAVAARQGGADARMADAERLLDRSQAPAAGTVGPDPQRVFGPVERAAREEGRIEGRQAAGEAVVRRGERLIEPSDAAVARELGGRPERVARAQGAAAEAGRQADVARERLGAQGVLAAPSSGRWWQTRLDDPRVVEPDAPIDDIDRRMVRDIAVGAGQEAANWLRARLGPSGRRLSDLTLFGQATIPPIPPEWFASHTGARSRGWQIDPDPSLGGEWDFLERTDEQTAAAWQAIAGPFDRRMAGPLDEHGRRLYRPALDDLSDALDEPGAAHARMTPDEVMDEVVRRIRLAISADQVTRGVRPWWPAELGLDPERAAVLDALPSETVADFKRNMYRPRTFRPRTSGRWNPDALDVAVRAVREVTNETAQADLIGPDPGVGPWVEMDEAAWSAEVERLATEHEAAIAGAIDDPEWGVTDAVVTRLEAELRRIVPPEFFADGADMSTTYQRLRAQTAKHHPDAGIGDGPVPQADIDAVATAESRAFEAWVADLEARDAAKAQGIKLEGAGLAVRGLTPDERAIYRQFDAEARQRGAENALEVARARAIESLRHRSPGQVVKREGERLIGQAGRLRARATAAADAGDGGLAARRTQVAQRLEAAGARRGKAEGARAQDARVAGELADVAAREDRRLNPVLGETQRERAVAALEERLRTGSFRQGRFVGRVERDAQVAERLLGRREERLARAQARLAGKETALEQGPPRVVPGKDRPVLLMSARIKKALIDAADERTRALAEELGQQVDGWTDDLSMLEDPEAQAMVTLAEGLPDLLRVMQGQFDEVGWERPRYVPGGLDDPMSGGFVGGAEDRLPKMGLTSAEQAKRVGRAPQRVGTIARTYMQEIGQIAENKAAQRMIDQGVAVPAQRIIEGLRGKVDDDIIDDLLAGRTAERAYDIGKALEREGYTPWDPEAPFSGVPPTSVNLGTLVIPTPIFKEFRRWFAKDKAPRWLELSVDKPTRGWKHMVLALNPYWQIGNMVGNTMMASIAGGVPPHKLARHGWQALKQLTEEGSTPRLVERTVKLLARDLKDRQGDVLFPARLYDAGTSAEMLRAISENRQELGRAMRVVQGSYNFNNFVDNLGRSTVYLAKKAKGLTDEQAVHASLRAMGDFSRMTAFEKNVVRRIFPFYSWMRHVLQLSWRLPLYHPYRVAATLHLANMHAPELPEGAPAWMRSALPIGDDRFLNLASFNPFTAGLTPLSAGEANPIGELARSVNPVGQAALAIGAGFNLRKFRMMTRPPGSGRFDVEGRPSAGPLAPSEALYWLSQQTPQTRLIHSAVAEPVIRYDQGDPMTAQGRELPLEGPRSESIIRNLGIPWPMTIDTEGQAQRARQRRLDNARARERYNRIVG